jgi:hypothetical protein
MTRKIKYDPDAPNLVADSEGFHIGIATGWNPVGVGECIVQFFAGDASSMLFSELIWPNGKDKAMDYLNNREPY